MSEIHLILPMQNECSSPIKLCLEPLCEFYLIQPNQRVFIHAIFNGDKTPTNFTVAPNNDGILVVYAPGDIGEFIDNFVTSDGQRLVPNSEIDK